MTNIIVNFSFFFYVFVQMGILKESMQNKQITLAYKYVDLCIFPLVHQTDERWECTEGNSGKL